jgi:molybdenum cofactor cytidylyltransferase
MKVAAIILAAGRGSRFGTEPKLLATLSGTPLIRHVAEAALASSAQPVIVVSGHHADEVERAIGDLDVIVVRNANFAEGLSTSLRAGFAALPGDVAAAVILLGDMPLVSSLLVDRIIAAWRSHACPMALVPIAGGRRANPVLLSRALSLEIEALTGDVGAAPLLRNRTGVVEWPVDEESVLSDIDTKESLSLLDRETGQDRK